MRIRNLERALEKAISESSNLDQKAAFARLAVKLAQSQISLRKACLSARVALERLKPTRRW